MADFGLVKEVDATAMTQTGVLMGTPAYAAPEQMADAAGSCTPAHAQGHVQVLLTQGHGRSDYLEAGLGAGHVIGDAELPRAARGGELHTLGDLPGPLVLGRLEEEDAIRVLVGILEEANLEIRATQIAGIGPQLSVPPGHTHWRGVALALAEDIRDDELPRADGHGQLVQLLLGIDLDDRTSQASASAPEVHPDWVQTQYGVRNWPEYEKALRDRGDVTIWISEVAIACWTPPSAGRRGGQPLYSDIAIQTVLTLRLLFHLPLRATEGFSASIDSCNKSSLHWSFRYRS